MKPINTKEGIEQRDKARTYLKNKADMEEIPKWEDLTKEEQKQVKEKLKEIFKLREILGINRIEEGLNKLIKELMVYKNQSGYSGYLG